MNRQTPFYNQNAKSVDIAIVTSKIGFHHADLAGYLSPRKLVRAQQLIAERQGCKIVDGRVQTVVRRNCDTGQESV